MARIRFLLLLLLLSLSIACSEDTQEPLIFVERDLARVEVDMAMPVDMVMLDQSVAPKGATLIFDPTSKDFFGLPYPSDAQKHPDGSIRLSDWSTLNPTGASANWFSATERLLKGWGLSSAVFLYFDAPIDVTSLPTLGNDTSAIILIDVDPESPQRGQRLPLECTFQLGRNTKVRRENEVSCLLPIGVTRRPNTTYAVVITDKLKAYQGELKIPKPATELLAGNPVMGWRGVIDGAPYLAARNRVMESGLKFEEIRALWTLTTGNPTAQVEELGAYFDSLTPPELDLEQEVEVIRRTEDFYVIQAFLKLPKVQEGTPPYSASGEGRLKRDTDGNIISSGEQTARLLLTLPRNKPMPAQGFPLLHYFPQDGLGVWAFVDRGASDATGKQIQENNDGPVSLVSPYGIAGFVMDYPFHGRRSVKGKLSSSLLLNYENMDAGIVNMHLAAAEQAYALRWLSKVSLDPSTFKTDEPLSGLDLGGETTVRFDNTRFVAMGHSLGSVVATMYATITSELDALILTGAGGNIVEQSLSSARLALLIDLLERSLNYAITDFIDRTDPVLHSLQYLWDLIDPIVYAPKLRQLDVLMHSGQDDDVYPEASRVGLASALGLDVVGEIVMPQEVEKMKALGPVKTLTYPVYTKGARTAALVQYRSQVINAHNLFYQREDAKKQVACFILSAGSSSSPKVLNGDDVTFEACQPE